MTRQFLGRVTIRQLRALIALEEAGSITSAAKRLNLTQPAVSLQLNSLKTLVGASLFERERDKIKLTEAGRQVLELASRIEAQLLDCERSLDTIKDLIGGHVSIAAESTAKYFVPYAIAMFSRRFPKVRVKLKIGNRDEIRAALHDYNVDIAIVGTPPADIDVEIRLLGKNPHIFIAAPDHSLACRKTVEIPDLDKEVIIAREIGSGTRMLLDQFLLNNGLKSKSSVLMDSNETIKQAVIAGLAIAFLSQHTIAHELTQGRLVALKMPGTPIIREWHAVRRVDKVLLPPAQAMLEFFGREGSNIFPASR